ncbi:MAG: hypothetical protein V3U39_08430 [Acidimicrobiia bacterium]
MKRCRLLIGFPLPFLFSFLLLVSPAMADGGTETRQVDHKAGWHLRALNMGGNWGLTSLINWGVDPPSADYLAFLDRIDANWVGISVSLHIDSSLDSSVERIYSGVDIPTFSDQALTVMIETLHSHGFKVFLTLAFDFDPPVEFPVKRWQLGDPKMPSEDPSILPENWPWALDHPNHTSFVTGFWQTYTEQAVYFATLAESLGVEMYSLGTETERLFRSRSGGYWPNHFGAELTTMVISVRAVYSGLLTYDMHYDALTPGYLGPGSDHLWEDLGLDVVGVSAYFPLVLTMPTTVLSVAELETSWQQVFADLLVPLRTRNPLLPIVLLEFGYVDAIESPYQPAYRNFTPWIFTDNNGNSLDDSQETQANIYQAFFNVNEQNSDLISGTFLWGHDWGSDDDWAQGFGKLHGFAIRDKLAEAVVAAQYASYLIFIDGFESRNTSAWSSTTGGGDPK